MYFNYCGELVEYTAGHQFPANDAVRAGVPNFEDSGLVHEYPEASPSTQLGWRAMWAHYATEGWMDKVFVDVKNI